MGLAQLGGRDHRRRGGCAKVALDAGVGGPLLGPSAYFMKSPPVQFHDDEAFRMVEAFASGDLGGTWPED